MICRTFKHDALMQCFSNYKTFFVVNYCGTPRKDKHLAEHQKKCPKVFMKMKML